MDNRIVRQPTINVCRIIPLPSVKTMPLLCLHPLLLAKRHPLRNCEKQQGRLWVDQTNLKFGLKMARQVNLPGPARCHPPAVQARAIPAMTVARVVVKTPVTQTGEPTTVEQNGTADWTPKKAAVLLVVIASLTPERKEETVDENLRRTRIATVIRTVVVTGIATGSETRTVIAITGIGNGIEIGNVTERGKEIETVTVAMTRIVTETLGRNARVALRLSPPQSEAMIVVLRPDPS